MKKSSNLLQAVPSLPPFLCALLLLFSKWCMRARQSVNLPLEHLLKMENKMHCDILANDLSLALGKASWMGTHCHSQKKTAQPKCHLRACLLLYFQCAFDYSSFSVLRIKGQSHSSFSFLFIKVSLDFLIKPPTREQDLYSFFLFQIGKSTFAYVFYLNDGEIDHQIDKTIFWAFQVLCSKH